MDEPNLPLVEQAAIAVVRSDDDELRAVERDVPFNQRQGALADGAEADHHDRPVETGVERPAVGRGDGSVHFGSPEQEVTWDHAACGVRLLSLLVKRATRVARSGRRSSGLRAAISPRAPSSDPALSSRASSRCASEGPGSHNAPVFSLEKPNRA